MKEAAVKWRICVSHVTVLNRPTGSNNIQKAWLSCTVTGLNWRSAAACEAPLTDVQSESQN